MRRSEGKKTAIPRRALELSRLLGVPSKGTNLRELRKGATFGGWGFSRGTNGEKGTRSSLPILRQRMKGYLGGVRVRF